MLPNLGYNQYHTTSSKTLNLLWNLLLKCQLSDLYFYYASIHLATSLQHPMSCGLLYVISETNYNDYPTSY